MPKVVFRDFLKEYDNLQFTFEYGFAWDNELANKIWGNTKQGGRNVNNENVWDNIASIEWRANEKIGASKQQRMLVNKNHYRMQKNLWIPYVYGMHGMQYSGGKGYFYQVENKTKKGIEEKEVTPRVMLKKYYSDEGRWVTSNIWTEKDMVNTVFKDKQEYETFVQMLAFFVEIAPLSVLGYNFLRRLSLAQKMLLCEDAKYREEGVVDIMLTNPYILVRKPFVHDALEQESIFRCLYAIKNGYKIQLGVGTKKTFIPQRLIYRDKGFESDKEHLYLEVVARQTNQTESNLQMQKSNIVVDFYYLEDGTTQYLRDRREKCHWKNNVQKEEKERRRISLQSPYYEGRDQEWIAERIVYQIKENDKEAFYDFIRSFGDFATIVEETDFVEDITIEKKTDSIEVPIYKGENITIYKDAYVDTTRIDKYDTYSLCNFYNSNGLFEAANAVINDALKEVNETGEIKKTKKAWDNVKKFIVPSYEEVEWVKFVLSRYPNFVKIFFGETDILSKLKEYMKTELTSDFFGEDDTKCQWSARIEDIEDERFAQKYHKILKHIQAKTILEYDVKRRLATILPYALEYHISKHCIGKNNIDQAMKIMCYDLREKRDVIVSVKEIKVSEEKTRAGNPITNFINQNEYEFSLLEKVYHLLAYGVRCSQAGKTVIDEEYANYIQLLFPEDNRKKKKTGKRENGIGTYNRVIIKKMNKPFPKKQMPTLMPKFYREVLKQKETDWKEGETFAYYASQEAEQMVASKQKEYYNWLQYFFYETMINVLVGKKVSKARQKEVIERLQSIENPKIWELIGGDDLVGIPNEIVYYDEVLKCETLSFELKEEVENTDDLQKIVQKIYELFSGYVCRGSKVDDKTLKLKFFLTYEKFNYRDIHMRMMMLSHVIDIESIEPFQERQILKQRYENMMGNQ